jgi:long-chain acyl-CoA synthetase
MAAPRGASSGDPLDHGPGALIRILEVPEAERAAVDTSSLGLVVHAAAPCPRSVKQRTMDALPHTAIWELYGGSEGGATRIGPDEWRERPGSVGLPWPGVEIRIATPEGHILPPGQDGLVWIKPMGGVKFHYHGDEDKTRQAWMDDWFTIGDVGHLDGDGYLFLTDRASDLVIRGGVNVYPREIEEILHQHADVVDCAVFGVPDERYGEELFAVVETARDVDPDALRAFVGEHLADYKIPRYVESVDELPRDPSGKILKRRLRERHWRGAATAIAMD